jgi:hypothetical protein
LLDPHYHNLINMVINMLAFFAAPALMFQVAAATPACVLQAVK